MQAGRVELLLPAQGSRSVGVVLGEGPGLQRSVAAHMIPEAGSTAIPN